MVNQPHEELTFHPPLVPPKLLPDFVQNLGSQLQENAFGFFEIKGALFIIVPS